MDYAYDAPKLWFSGALLTVEARSRATFVFSTFRSLSQSLFSTTADGSDISLPKEVWEVVDLDNKSAPFSFCVRKGRLLP